MRAIKSLRLLFVAIFLIVGCSGASIHQVDSDRIIMADNVAQLEAVSDLVVAARVLPEKENVLVESKDGSVLFGYTLTNLKVTDVFHGNADVGDTVEITEEYWQIDSDIYTQGNYLPARVGGDYIFYLMKYDDESQYQGLYFPVDLERGKYSLNQDMVSKLESIDDFTHEQLEIVEADDEYKEWYKQVVEKHFFQN